MKKIYSALFICFSLFISCIPSFAQFHYPKQEYAKELKNRTLIVELFEEVSAVEKATNEDLKKSFKENWNFCLVEFKYRDEIEKIDSNQRSQYALLRHEYKNTAIQSVERDEKAWQHPQPKTVAGVTYHDPGVSYEKVKNGKSYTRTIGRLTSYHLNLYLFRESKNSKIFSVGFVHYFLNELDYLFAIQQMQNHLNSSNNGIPGKDFYNVDQNLAELEKKTLLLEKEHLQFKEEEVPYEYAYKVVSEDEYKTALLKKDNNYIYSKLIWSDQHPAFAYVAVDAASGKILSLITMGGVNKTGFGEFRPTYELKKIHLKSFHLKWANNLNNRYKKS